VVVQLPAAWEASSEFTTIVVRVEACESCAVELQRRADAVVDARSDYHSLLRVVDLAVLTDIELRERLRQALGGEPASARYVAAFGPTGWTVVDRMHERRIEPDEVWSEADVLQSARDLNDAPAYAATWNWVPEEGGR
jgi:hypothetical protein